MMFGAKPEQMPEARSVADIVGPWRDPDFESSLIERCMHYWTTPIGELSDLMVATYLNQKFAVEQMKLEAKRRLDGGLRDDSELFDGQLAESLARSEFRIV
jgi:hypothetical protein